ncbi:MAG: riboflavin synthase [Flavobacteriaceae bacterium]|jgi:riboflavin synthase|nr:riboflavin synthase [Flavobacteriaceae bacterium]MDG1774702.1 riboflavin synthase [Flavobacteriaceae bacterium]MDG2414716.1 riboflavin synthase [Flavobacteriaceae bacterium]
MFTGIIETLGKVVGIDAEGSNLHLRIETPLANELKIDQSVAHNGVCLTVVEKTSQQYTVTAIAETLEKTSLNHFKVGQLINLERAMILGSRLDGHIVQGHVDQTGVCSGLKEEDGSWVFTFTYDPDKSNVTIEKGSITIDGTSLTVVNSEKNSFSVAIIPYTYAHTCFQQYEIGTVVNLEFDVIGKYVKRLLEIGK